MNPNTRLTIHSAENQLMRVKIQARGLKEMAKLVSIVDDAGHPIALRSYKRLFFVLEHPSEGLISELCRQGAGVTQDQKFSAD